MLVEEYNRLDIYNMSQYNIFKVMFAEYRKLLGLHRII